MFRKFENYMAEKMSAMLEKREKHMDVGGKEFNLYARYLVGACVVLDVSDDEKAPPAGTVGFVDFADEKGGLWVFWDGGFDSLISSPDKVHFATPQEEYLRYVHDEASHQFTGIYCPRCGGPMRGRLEKHRVSKHAKIYICNRCSRKETNPEEDLKNWYCVRIRTSGTGYLDHERYGEDRRRLVQAVQETGKPISQVIRMLESKKASS